MGDSDGRGETARAGSLNGGDEQRADTGAPAVSIIKAACGGLLDGAGELARDRSLGRWHVVGTSRIPAAASSAWVRRRGATSVSALHSHLRRRAQRRQYRTAVLRVISAWQEGLSRCPRHQQWTQTRGPVGTCTTNNPVRGARCEGEALSRWIQPK